MHKSAGNAIEFDEAADRMGVDVMRWMFAKARPEENILFGWHAADEARRELLVLWNVYAFFVTYARLAGWTPGRRRRRRSPSGRSSTAGSCRARPARRRRSRRACATSTPSARPGRCRRYLDDLSTWYLRLSRRRFSRSDDPRRPATRRSRRSTRRSWRRARMLAPILPFLAEAMYGNLVATVAAATAPDSVHLTRWPTAELAAHRDERARGARWRSRRAPSTSPGRCAARPASRPASRSRRPGSPCPDRGLGDRRRTCSRSSPTRSTSRRSSVIDDESALVERRVKPLLPKIGKRLGSAIPAVMAAARAGEVTFEPDGSVTLGRRDAGTRRGRDPGDAAAGDGRRPPRRPGRRPRHGADAGAAWPRATPASWPAPIQDLRREAGLELDDRIELWVDGAARRTSRRTCRRSPPTRSPTLGDGRRRRADARRRDGRARRRPGRHRPASRREPVAGGDARRGCDDEAGTDAPATLPPTRSVGTTSPPPAARRSGAHWLVFIGLALGGRGRRPARPRPGSSRNLSPGEAMTVIGDCVRLIFSQNSGALFGLFRDNARRCSGSSRSSSSA